MLDDNFVLAITNIDPETGHGDHEDHDSGDDEKDGDDSDEDDETELQFKARVARGKQRFKEEVKTKYQNRNKSAFKCLFRSKGFIWLSNYPKGFFIWSHSGIQLFIEGENPLEDQKMIS